MSAYTTAPGQADAAFDEAEECAVCGARLPPEAEYCMRCGSPAFRRQEPDLIRAMKQRIRAVRWRFALALLGVVGLPYLLYFTGLFLLLALVEGERFSLPGSLAAFSATLILFGVVVALLISPTSRAPACPACSNRIWPGYGAWKRMRFCPHCGSRVGVGLRLRRRECPDPPMHVGGTCTLCGAEHPMKAWFCHACGARLVYDPNLVGFYDVYGCETRARCAWHFFGWIAGTLTAGFLFMALLIYLTAASPFGGPIDTLLGLLAFAGFLAVLVGMIRFWNWFAQLRSANRLRCDDCGHRLASSSLLALPAYCCRCGASVEADRSSTYVRPQEDASGDSLDSARSPS